MFRQKRQRDILLQVLFIGFIAFILLSFGYNSYANIQAQGLTSGFGFLSQATGWDVSFSLIPYETSDPYWKVLLVGFLNTLFVGFTSIFFSIVIGLGVGILRTLPSDFARLLGTIYVEIFRNVPLLLQLLFWYAILKSLPHPRDATDFMGLFFTGRGSYFPAFNVTPLSIILIIVTFISALASTLWLKFAQSARRLPPLTRWRRIRIIWVVALILSVAIFFWGRVPGTPLLNVPLLKGLNIQGGIRVPPELLSCLVAISIYGAAYTAEIIRSGLNAVGRGQDEAGHALGLSRWQIFTRIRLPLAVRIVLPALTNQFIWLMKATTVGIAVGFVDFYAAVSTSFVQTGRTFELIFILMAGFLLVNYALSFVLNRINKAVALKGNQLRM